MYIRLCVSTGSYDDRGRLVDVDSGSVIYEHNGQGQRVRKDDGSNETLYVYDEAGHLIGEYDDSGNLIQEHVWFNGMPVAVLTNSDEYYVHTDHLGTPRIVSDGNTSIWRWESGPFGEEAAQEDPDNDTTDFTYNLRFPGQYYDAETGLHYNYYRTYDPSTGRYLESDPIGLQGGLNTYGYVGGNPLLNYDPYGLYNYSDFVNDAADFSAGFGDLISFGITKKIRESTDIGAVNECSSVYRAGKRTGVGFSLVGGGAVTARAFGWVVRFDRYRRAGGGGMNVLRYGERRFALDWHRFKLDGRMVNRPHYHRGPTKSQMKKHRPYQGGW